MKPIRVLLADDHTILRAGLRALLGDLPDLEIVGEASSGEEALVLIEALRPDVLLCDISMPGQSGLEVAELVARDFPGTRTIILSMHSEKQYAVRACRPARLATCSRTRASPNWSSHCGRPQAGGCT